MSSPAHIKQNVYQFELKNIYGQESNYLNAEIVTRVLIPDLPYWMFNTFGIILLIDMGFLSFIC